MRNLFSEWCKYDSIMARIDGIIIITLLLLYRWYPHLLMVSLPNLQEMTKFGASSIKFCMLIVLIKTWKICLNSSVFYQSSRMRKCMKVKLI